jgi:hypothetical protein
MGRVVFLLFVLLQICVVSFAEASKVSTNQIQVPILFETNYGQSGADVKYIARARGYTALLESNSVRFVFPDSTSEVRIRLEGANRNPELNVNKITDSEVNYFIGNNSSDWQTRIPTYAAVTYKNVYQGIDWTFYEKDGLLEYDFFVAPGSDLSQIRMSIEGVTKISIEDNGILNADPLKMLAPFVYQGTNEIQSKYILGNDKTIQFAIDSYDEKKPLVIDPKISFSSLFGSPEADAGTDIAVDAKGDFYVVGYSSSPRPPYGKSIIMKFNAAGTLLWSAIVGGSGGDAALGVTTTPAGIVYVVGSTSSRDFPVVGGFQAVYAGGISDGFIVKLSTNGSQLLRSSYIGGAGNDLAQGIQLGTGSKLQNGIYIFGNTDSRNFPQINSNQNQLRAPVDGFLTIVNSPNFTRVMSSYIGTNGRDDITSLNLNPTRGDLYLIVQNETNFNLSVVAQLKPTDANRVYPAGGPIPKYSRNDKSFHVRYGGGLDLLSKFRLLSLSVPYPQNPQLSSQAAGTGIILVAGYCLLLPPSTTCDFSSSLALFDQDLNFVSGVNFATFAGLYTNDVAFQGGRIYLVGETTSNNLPIVNAVQATRKGGWEGFLIEMEPSGNILTSTYLGGTGYEFIQGVAVSKTRNIYLVGTTTTKNFPTTPNAIKRSVGGTQDAFVIKITP